MVVFSRKFRRGSKQAKVVGTGLSGTIIRVQCFHENTSPLAKLTQVSGIVLSANITCVSSFAKSQERIETSSSLRFSVVTEHHSCCVIFTKIQHPQRNKLKGIGLSARTPPVFCVFYEKTAPRAKQALVLGSSLLANNPFLISIFTKLRLLVALLRLTISVS